MILEPESIGAAIYVRHGEDWIGTSLLAGDILDMPEIEASIRLDDIHADVDLPEIENLDDAPPSER